MNVLLIGGPKDGDMVHVEDGTRTIAVPVPDTATWTWSQGEYAVGMPFPLGPKQLGAVGEWKGIRANPDVLVQDTERNEVNEQQESKENEPCWCGDPDCDGTTLIGPFSAPLGSGAGRVSASGGGGGGSVSLTEDLRKPERKVSNPSAGGGEGKRADAAGPDGRSPRCRRKGGDPR